MWSALARPTDVNWDKAERDRFSACGHKVIAFDLDTNARTVGVYRADVISNKTGSLSGLVRMVTIARQL